MSGIGTGVDFFVDPNAIESSPIALIVTVANTIQHDRLKGLPVDETLFPFSILAENVTYSEFPTEDFPDLEFDPVTGTITGFLVGIGKKVFITPLM